MGKWKSGSGAVPVDENDDGWLSTRNKKKISPPPLKKPGAQHSLRRPVPRSPLVLLMDDAPSQLISTKKQTSIADFFTPRLQELSSTDCTKKTGLTRQHNTSHQDDTTDDPEDENYAMYTDFDMPPPTPSQTPTNTPSTIFFSKSSSTSSSTVEDRVSSDSAEYRRGSGDRFHHGERSSIVEDRVSSGNSEHQPGSGNGFHNGERSFTVKDRVSSGITEYQRGSGNGFHNGDFCSTLKNCVECATSSHQDDEAVSVRVREIEGTHKNQWSSQSERSALTMGVGADSFVDSLLTPDFLKGASNTLETDCEEHSVHLPSSSIVAGVKRKRQKSTNDDDDLPSDSQERDTFYTDMKSIKFTDSSQPSSLSLRCTSDLHISADDSDNPPQQTCEPRQRVTSESNRTRFSNQGKEMCNDRTQRKEMCNDGTQGEELHDDSTQGEELRADSTQGEELRSDSTQGKELRGDSTQGEELRADNTQGEELRVDSLMTPMFSSTAVGDSLQLDESEYTDRPKSDKQRTRFSVSQFHGLDMASDDLQTPGFLEEWHDNSNSESDNDY